MSSTKRSRSSITPWQPNPVQNGVAISRVVKASDQSPIENTQVAAYLTSGEYAGSASTDSAGQFELFLPEGDYNFVAYKDGYMPGILKGKKIENGQVHYMEWLSLATDSGNSEYTVKGKITDAATGSNLSGVSMTFTSVFDTTKTYSATTNSSGQYSKKLPTGYYTVELTKTKYIASEFSVASSTEMESINQNGTMSPTIDGNTFRIVLTWNASPNDLDSHTVGKKADGSSFHAYYRNKTETDGNVQIVTLDVDDRDGYGPETTTLIPTTSSAYTFYVHQYSSGGAISTSGAQVKVYNGNRQIATYNAPTDQGTGRYWNVFSIKDGRIIAKNTITSSPDTSYAS